MGCMQSFITSLAFVKLSELPTTHVTSAYPREPMITPVPKIAP